MSQRPPEARSSTWFDVVASLVLDRSRRISLLIVIAYASAFVGLGAVFAAADPGPESRLTTLGIALMGLSFVCLFVVSVSVLDLAGGG